jgi:5-(carboxyamino)imidazole ribonucleotide mutase
MSTAPVAIIMGSRSDWSVMRAASSVLEELGVPCHHEVVSAHRTPQRLASFAAEAAERGFQVVIAGAGGAAHLPGMLAAQSLLPVIGVPIPATALVGVDALLSIAQMPAGVPVATMAIGIPGATNAGLFAAALLAVGDPDLRARLSARREAAAAKVLAHPDPREDPA